MLNKMRYYAVLSGISAALASLLGKLAGMTEWITPGESVLKIIFLLGMFACNACVWTFFVRALQDSTSTLSVTVTSTASNYICSALVGYLFFNEITSLMWWMGSSLIIMGIVFLSLSQENTLKTKNS